MKPSIFVNMFQGYMYIYATDCCVYPSKLFAFLLSSQKNYSYILGHKVFYMSIELIEIVIEVLYNIKKPLYLGLLYKSI